MNAFSNRSNQELLIQMLASQCRPQVVQRGSSFLQLSSGSSSAGTSPKTALSEEVVQATPWEKARLGVDATTDLILQAFQDRAALNKKAKAGRQSDSSTGGQADEVASTSDKQDKDVSKAKEKAKGSSKGGQKTKAAKDKGKKPPSISLEKNTAPSAGPHGPARQGADQELSVHARLCATWGQSQSQSLA